MSGDCTAAARLSSGEHDCRRLDGHGGDHRCGYCWRDWHMDGDRLVLGPKPEDVR